MSSDFADVYPGDLQLRFIDIVCAHYSLLEVFWGYPRLDDGNPSRLEVTGHVPYRPPHSGLTLHVTDRTEETSDDVELSLEFEPRHISVMKDNVSLFLASDPEHLWTNIQPFHCVVLFQM